MVFQKLFKFYYFMYQNCRSGEEYISNIFFCCLLSGKNECECDMISCSYEKTNVLLLL